jgi:hypothetical protein
MKNSNHFATGRQRLLFYTGILGLAGLVLASVAAYGYAGSPTMEILSYNYSNGLYEYLVTNTSSPDDVYEMNKFVLPVGLNHGVYDAIGPDNWTFTINLDETVFSTTLPGAYIKPDGGHGSFEVHSHLTDDVNGDARAYTLFEEPFNSARVVAPPLLGDLNLDRIVNFLDFARLAGEWMQEGDLVSDINNNGAGDGIVDYQDLLVLAEQWLMEGPKYDTVTLETVISD